MITTLAWVVFDIQAPPWRASSGLTAAQAAGAASSFPLDDAWTMYGFRGSYARYATPRTHSLHLCGSLCRAGRVIMFRETLFRGMDVPTLGEWSFSCPPASMPSTARS